MKTITLKNEDTQVVCCVNSDGKVCFTDERGVLPEPYISLFENNWTHSVGMTGTSVNIVSVGGRPGMMADYLFSKRAASRVLSPLGVDCVDEDIIRPIMADATKRLAEKMESVIRPEYAEVVVKMGLPCSDDKIGIFVPAEKCGDFCDIVLAIDNAVKGGYDAWAEMLQNTEVSVIAA